MATQPEPKPDDLPLRQHGRMADIMTTILTTGDVNAKVGRKLPRTAVWIWRPFSCRFLFCRANLLNRHLLRFLPRKHAPPYPKNGKRRSRKKKAIVRATIPMRIRRKTLRRLDVTRYYKHVYRVAFCVICLQDSSVVKSCHVLPAAASLDQERKLQRIATRGGKLSGICVITYLYVCGVGVWQYPEYPISWFVVDIREHASVKYYAYPGFNLHCLAWYPSCGPTWFAYPMYGWAHYGGSHCVPPSSSGWTI